jgi:hypothetical protein
VHKLIALLSWAALSVGLNAQITLGTTVGTFGVLAGSTVTSTGNTLVSGNLGVSPGTAITGITGIAPGGPGIVSGTIHSADAFAATAQSELTAAYNAVAAVPSTATWTTDLGGHTFYVGGVYTAPSTSLGLTGTVTLDCTTNPNGQIIFQIGSTLTTASNSSVNLVNCLPTFFGWSELRRLLEQPLRFTGTYWLRMPSRSPPAHLFTGEPWLGPPRLHWIPMQLPYRQLSGEREAVPRYREVPACRPEPLRHR